MKRYLYLFGALLATACNSGTETTVKLTREKAGRIVEYTPAPGQFVNDPESGFTDITTKSEACAYARERLAAGNYVSLGAWGGYLVAQFDTPVPASDGYELWVEGNSFDGSSEPGVVWVMQDANGNKLPDDTWYELRGSEYDASVRDYRITYRKPDAEGNIVWSDADGNTGVLPRNEFHTQQSYFPSWVETDQITFRGTLLPGNVTLEHNIYVLHAFGWGYADNASMQDTVEGVNRFRIADAVTPEGQSAGLTQVDFIKVQTGVNDCRPGIGELSTEVCGIGCYRTLTVTE